MSDNGLASKRMLPKNKSEQELEELVSECKALQAVLESNIKELLESFETDLQILEFNHDNYQGEENRDRAEG
nr:hypothetical protein 82 [bacterium]